MRQPTGAARSTRIAFKISKEDREQIDQAVKTRGYESPSALIRAKERYDRLMKTAGQSMSNGAHLAMQDLTGHEAN